MVRGVHSGFGGSWWFNVIVVSWWFNVMVHSGSWWFNVMVRGGS